MLATGARTPILLIRRGGSGGIVTEVVAIAVALMVQVVVVTMLVVVTVLVVVVVIGVISKLCPSGRGGESEFSPSNRGGDEDENSSMSSYNKGVSLWRI